jgi:hypothetical protein
MYIMDWKFGISEKETIQYVEYYDPGSQEG